MRSTMQVAFLLISVVSVSANFKVPAAFTARGGSTSVFKFRKDIHRHPAWTGEGNLRRYASAYTSGYQSATTSAPTTAPTPPPTPAPTKSPTSSPTPQGKTPTTIVHRIIFTGDASTFTAAKKELTKLGYAVSMGMYNPDTKSWVQGFNPGMIEVVLARRAFTVVFTTKIPDETLAANVKTAANGITKASLTTAMTEVKTKDTVQFGSVTVPTVDVVAAPTITDPVIIISGATSTVITSMWAITSLWVAFLLVAGVSFHN